jgi:hypothetical protein
MNGHPNNSRPTAPAIAGQYTTPFQQTFAPSPPQQSGKAVPIPQTNMGITVQRGFAKITALAKKPLAKIVIAAQQARF